MDPNVVDLADVKRAADERDAQVAQLAQAAHQEAIQTQAIAWHRAMRRTFKGIYRDSERLRALRRDV